MYGASVFGCGGGGAVAEVQTLQSHRGGEPEEPEQFSFLKQMLKTFCKSLRFCPKSPNTEKIQLIFV
jgi:hypothetical protein